VVPGGDQLQVTQSGIVLGTPTTMAPEQFEDPDGVDFRADIYGLGCVLYEALTGQHAFSGSTFTQLIDAKRSGVVPDPSSARRDLQRATIQAVQAFLQPRRARRPADYGKAIALLDRALAVCDPELANHSAASRIGPGLKLMLVVGIVIVGALVAGGVYSSVAPGPGSGGQDPDLHASDVESDEGPAVPPVEPADEEPLATAPAEVPPPDAASFAALTFGEAATLWGPDYATLLAPWEHSGGGWAPTGDVTGAVLTQRGGHIERALPALPLRISGAVAVVDVGQGGATEFGVFVRDAEGRVHAWAAKALGGLLLGYERHSDDPERAELIGVPISLALPPAGEAVSFTMTVLPGGVQVRVGGQDLGIQPLPAPPERLGLFSRGGGALFQDLQAAGLAD